MATPVVPGGAAASHQGGAPSSASSSPGSITSRPASHGSGSSPPPSQLGVTSAGPTASRPQQHDPQPTQHPIQTAAPMQPPAPRPQEPAYAAEPAGSPGQESQIGVDGYASPGVNTPRGVEGLESYSAIADTIAQADAGVVRQVVREEWERCLMGSEYHSAFVLNATIHQASPAMLSRVVQGFAAKLMRTCGAQLLEHLTTEDFDQVTDLVLSRLSPSFLDRALAQRLETIDARSLVNALARAERLGYDVQDIVEEKAGDDGAEHVIPSLHGVSPLPSSRQSASPPPPDSQWAQRPQPGQRPRDLPWRPSAAQPSSNDPPPPHLQLPSQRPPQPKQQTPTRGPAGFPFCQDCGRPCSGESALQYHVKKKACDPYFNCAKLGKTICPHCGYTFEPGTGTLYHMKGEVCGSYTEKTTNAIWRALGFYSQRSQATAAIPRLAPPPAPTPNPSSNALNDAKDAGSGGTISGGEKPYAHLTQDARRRYQEEQSKAEAKYGALMREAMTLPEPERTDKLSRLKNSYNTKQSTTRKRFGIRLRERRTKEEVEAERIRLLGTPDANEVWLEQERAASRLRARNDKTRSTSTGGASDESGPATIARRRVPLSEMGGLSGSAGSAETTDPTAYLTSNQPRGAAQQPTRGTHDDPMSVDEDTEADEADKEKSKHQGRSLRLEPDSDDGSSTDDDTDILATG